MAERIETRSVPYRTILARFASGNAAPGVLPPAVTATATEQAPGSDSKELIAM
jgi:hypothetical protein